MNVYVFFYTKVSIILAMLLLDGGIYGLIGSSTSMSQRG